LAVLCGNGYTEGKDFFVRYRNARLSRESGEGKESVGLVLLKDVVQEGLGECTGWWLPMSLLGGSPEFRLSQE